MLFFDTCNAVAARDAAMRNYLMLRSKRSVLRRQCSDIYKSKYKKVGVIPIWKAKSNVSSVGPLSERNEGPISSKRWTLLSVSAEHQRF